MSPWAVIHPGEWGGVPCSSSKHRDATSVFPSPNIMLLFYVKRNRKHSTNSIPTESLSGFPIGTTQSKGVGLLILLSPL